MLFFVTLMELGSADVWDDCWSPHLGELELYELRQKLDDETGNT